MIRAVLLNTGSEKPNKSRLVWWAHKGSNLGPLPCEGNALPLSYAPGNFRARSKALKSASDRDEPPCQSPRFTKCRLPVSSCRRVETGLARKAPSRATECHV